MGQFSKKTVYHSELRTQSEQHGLWLSFVEHPSQSRYKSPRFVVENDDTQYSYKVENDRIARHLEAAPTGVWLFVKAHESKEAAYLEIEDEANEPVAEPAPPATPPPAQRSAPPPRQAPSNNQGGDQARGGQRSAPSGPPSNGDHRGDVTLAQITLRSLIVAHDIVEAYREKFGEEPTEAVRTLAAGMTIEFHRNQGRIPIARAKQAEDAPAGGNQEESDG